MGATSSSTASSRAKRATVYFRADLHRALRLRAATMDRTLSDIVNDAVQRALREDAEDLELFEKRAKEPSLDYETVVRTLKRRGKI